MTGRLLRAGERGVLVELDGLDAVLGLNAHLDRLVATGNSPWDLLEDRVPAATTLLLTVRHSAALGPVRAGLRTLLAELDTSDLGAGAGDATTVEITVHYDGPDLADVAELTGLSPAEVVAAHTGRRWRVGFVGFAPGFAYLVDGDPRLNVPRRKEPRTSVPAGAVGLAGHFSGVYPRSSPGGWQLIGHTEQHLWDPNRKPPALLQPGAWVRFVDGGNPS